MSTDAIADAFEYAETRLTEWGAVCGNAGDAVGLPKRSSTLERIADQRHILEFNHHQFKREIKRLSLPSSAMRTKHKTREKPRRMQCPGCRRWFQAQRECSHCGRDALTADGKPSMTMKLPSFRLPASVVEVEAIISALPKWMRTVLRHTYLFGEPDRFAADDLKIRPQEYAARRRAAVQRVADLLRHRT